MAESAQTRREAKLRAMLRQAGFEGWAHDRLVGEIENLYGKTRTAKTAAKRTAKK